MIVLPFLLWNRVSRAMLAVAITSGALTAVTGWKFLAREPVRVSLNELASADTVATSSQIRLRLGRNAEHVLRAVLHTLERDPFSAARRRPSGRYLLPGEQAKAPASEEVQQIPPAPTFAPPVSVHGIATTTEGRGLAALQVAGGPVQVVAVGEHVGGYRTTSITPGEVRLEGADTTIVLRFGSPAQ